MNSMIRFSLLAVAALAVTGCNKSEQSTGGGGGSATGEKAAIAAFEKAGKEMKAWMDEEEKKSGGAPGPGMIAALITKMKTLPTEGLPADLKAGFENLCGSIQKMGDLMKEFPAKQEDMQAFMQKKLAENPEFLKNFQAKMGEITKEGDAARSKMEELAKKYGMENTFAEKSKEKEKAKEGVPAETK